MKTAVTAALLAGATALTVLAAPAEAATIIQRTSGCADGGFSGRFTLRYETSGSYHKIIGAVTASGPYIGDSGTLTLRISYVSGTMTHTVYTRSLATTGSTSLTFPTGTDVPLSSSAKASTTFDNGSASCTATVLIS